MLEIGSLIDGKYKILNEVGHGGMSVVYLAMNEKANKQWAIKEVRKDGVKDHELVRQGLIAEVDILKKLSHPALPSIIDVIDWGDSFLIVMDYIQGNSLKQALDEYGALPQDDVIKWAMQLCDVLGYLHTRNPPIIYRDMKPANIMLKPDGNISLIDFGTAREFKAQNVNLDDTVSVGTIGYAAPEQYGGRGQSDARTDIYNLGVTLHYLLTGVPPSSDPYGVLRPIREINPALSVGLERIILKCTQQDARNRYQSAAELMYALQHYKENDDVYSRKQKGKLAAFLTPAVLSIVLAAVSVWGYMSAEAKKRENYDYLLRNAASVDDYYEAIVTDPTRADAYLGNGEVPGIISFLTSDGELTTEEGATFTELRGGLTQTDREGYSSDVNVLETLKTKNPEVYEDVCYEVGEAYLFYYTIGVEKDKYAQAASWFKDAGDRYPDARMYCEISDCLQNIEKYRRAEQYAKLSQEFETLWEKEKDLLDRVEDFDEDMRLRVWNEVVRMISENAAAFCEVAPKEEISGTLTRIANGADGIGGAFLEDSLATLRANLETARAKVLSVKDQAEEGE